MENWIEYTQLASRDDDKHLVILEEKRDEVRNILSNNPPFIDRPEDHEFFQRKFGLDPKHRKDTRNLEKTKTITARIIAEEKIKQAYIRASIARPITGITPELIADITEETGIKGSLVEDVLNKTYPHGTVGAFMSSYFEMAFKGTEEAVDFEKATTQLFHEVFKYTVYVHSKCKMIRVELRSPSAKNFSAVFHTGHFCWEFGTLPSSISYAG